MDEVVYYALDHGWQVMHIKPAKVAGRIITPTNPSGKGYPDLTLAKNGVVHFWECKAPGKKPTPDQVGWLEATGGRVIYPSDWAYIKEVLG